MTAIDPMHEDEYATTLHELLPGDTGVIVRNTVIEGELVLNEVAFFGLCPEHAVILLLNAAQQVIDDLREQRGE